MLSSVSVRLPTAQRAQHRTRQLVVRVVVDGKAPASPKKPAAAKAAPAAKEAVAGPKGKAPVAPAKAAAPAKPAKKAPAVKRAPTASQLFFKTAFKDVMSKHPDVKAIGERMKLVREAWEQLPADKKAPFEKEAAVLKAKADSERAALKAKKAANAKPLTAYMQFSKDVRPEMTAKYPSAKVTEIVKHIGGAWKALSEDKKAVYQDKYKAEMEKWKAAQGKAASA